MARYVATPFVAGKPNTEVIGQVVISFSENLESDVIAPILPKHGLDNIQPDQWYSHQAWMNLLKDLSEMHGGGWRWSPSVNRSPPLR